MIRPGSPRPQTSPNSLNPPQVRTWVGGGGGMSWIPPLKVSLSSNEIIFKTFTSILMTDTVPCRRIWPVLPRGFPSGVREFDFLMCVFVYAVCAAFISSKTVWIFEHVKETLSCFSLQMYVSRTESLAFPRAGLLSPFMCTCTLALQYTLSITYMCVFESVRVYMRKKGRTFHKTLQNLFLKQKRRCLGMFDN